MDDALSALDSVQDLPPEERALARALIRNELVDTEAVLEAARSVAGEPGGKGLLDRLVEGERLTHEGAERILDALRKKRDEARTSRRMWRPRRERRAEPEERREEPPRPKTAEEIAAARERRERREQQAVDAFIEKYIRWSAAPLVLQTVARQQAGVIDIKQLLARLGINKKELRAILEEWRRLGLLKTVGAYPFYYDPSPREREAAKLFFKQWAAPASHARIMAKILEMEKK